MSAPAEVLWCQHPTTGKWHAFRRERADRWSVCGYTTTDHGWPTATEVLPDGARPCLICASTLRISVTRAEPPPVESAVEEMWARFEGGPFDGERIPLKVIRTSPTKHRVLASNYDRSTVAEQLAAVKEWEQGTMP